MYIFCFNLGVMYWVFLSVIIINVKKNFSVFVYVILYFLYILVGVDVKLKWSEFFYLLYIYFLLWVGICFLKSNKLLVCMFFWKIVW